MTRQGHESQSRPADPLSAFSHESVVTDTRRIAHQKIDCLCNVTAGAVPSDDAQSNVETWAFDRTVDAYQAALAAKQPVKHVLTMQD